MYCAKRFRRSPEYHRQDAAGPQPLRARRTMRCLRWILQMALGATRSLVDALSKLQRVDLPQAIVRAAQAFDGHWHDAALVPSNLIPYLRAVLAGAITHEKDAMVMDFVSLLFDYAFRDPSIPESLHGVFERLQVPIVKIALIDSEFFTPKRSSGSQAARQPCRGVDRRSRRHGLFPGVRGHRDRRRERGMPLPASRRIGIRRCGCRREASSSRTTTSARPASSPPTSPTRWRPSSTTWGERKPTRWCAIASRA